MTPNIPKMVMCNMEHVMIPRPPPLGPLMSNLGQLIPSLGPPPLKAQTKTSRTSSKNSTRSQGGFRLVENQDDTGSVYSVYKQKIDSMFESDSSSAKNSVQAKIEKMFTEVAIDNGIPLNEIGIHTFSVDYLGSVPLQDKVTSLSGLQTPLRQLYFQYKKITKHKKTLTGRLEISCQGLKVQYQGDKGDLEQLNSFPTIAVWSAVKFVIQNSNKYAFLPLITDPDNIDKQALFKSLNDGEKKYINAESHSPLFAVVMRKIGVHKQLECHGFVCQTSEDAIVIAATLYKSLVTHMKAKEKKPRNKNGVTCMSLASSTYHDGSMPVRPPRKKRSTTSSIVSESDNLQVSDTQPLLSPPSKQPKKSTKTRRAPKAPLTQAHQDLDAIMPYEEPVKIQDLSNNSKDKILNDSGNQYNEIAEIKPKKFSDKISTYMSREQKQITEEIKQVMSESSSKGLKKVQNMRKSDDDTMRKKENSGDILTKVTIPRSGSFLNTGGLTRYKNKISRNNEQASGGSPLGFKEIFHELSIQEGLHSMDDILSVIIDPEGMSFNDLKPIYKEFLLKLSVTLTKDELYQRSKSIMRRQKKKLLRRNSNLNKSHHIRVGAKIKRLKHIFQKSFRSKLVKNSNKSNKSTKEVEKPNPTEGKPPESSISTSSYDTRQFRPKDETPGNAKKQSYRKKQNELNRSRRDRTSTSEESDFFSLKRNKSKSQSLNNQNRNSSSGYVSCSECSYDSDTCTCISADKCYCSLGNKNQSRKSNCNTCKTSDKCYCSLNPSSFSFCGCDTDSCAESNKCYCASTPRNSTILEQLKQRGFMPKNNMVEGAPKHRKVCKNNSNTKSTRSLEYMPNPSEKYYEKLNSTRGHQIPPTRRSVSQDNLALDYDIFAITNGIRNLHNRAALYSRSISECGQINLRNHESMRSFSSHAYGNNRGRSAISSGQCTEALSVKKSAEIAALFADIKLSQTTDITHLSRNFDMDSLLQCRNTYNNYQSQGPYTKSSSKNGIKRGSHKMVENSLYSSKCNGGKNNMYSTKNGLYTIQSQSESGSGSDRRRRRQEKPKYFELDPKYTRKLQNEGNSLENSLGYLP
ncbi:unnamed protein product [Brassicogethes aeneus]|uniref:PID domain-containing protein n=1 Tax=Brassicogethes aeneus TaxID=1431903 RepID=A0A9P0ATP4_BRAAE|nr:unnamed protein product [Brassicogethes aeneus]